MCLCVQVHPLAFVKEWATGMHCLRPADPGADGSAGSSGRGRHLGVVHAWAAIHLSLRSHLCVGHEHRAVHELWEEEALQPGARAVDALEALQLRPQRLRGQHGSGRWVGCLWLFEGRSSGVGAGLCCAGLRLLLCWACWGKPRLLAPTIKSCLVAAILPTPQLSITSTWLRVSRLRLDSSCAGRRVCGRVQLFFEQVWQAGVA